MHKVSIFACVLISFLLVACRPQPVVTTVVSTPSANVSATEGTSTPLSRTGQYSIATRELIFNDDTRGGQEISIPMVFPGTGNQPDMSGAPYPVIIYSHGGDVNDGFEHRWNNWDLLSHLASYGFFIVAPQHETEAQFLVTDRPMDILAVIAELDLLARGEFAGVIDMDRIGMLGASAGSTTALLMGGARLDSQYYEDWCAQRPGAYYCPDWILSTYKQVWSEALLTDSDGLYYVDNDTPIRALALLAPCFQPLFGDRGLAIVTSPILLLAPTKDEGCNYQDETLPLYQSLGSKNRYLINLIDGMHSDVLLDTAGQKTIITAFFAYYLKGQEDYAQYLTKDFVNSLQKYSWGVYQP